MAQIETQQLSKTFRVAEREAGLGAALRSLFHRRYKYVQAVDHIDLRIEAGEIVGFLGPNGAGKTTALKMLSGLMHPSGGTARVLGYVPWKRQNEFLRQISLVMGQRSQLYWDLPASDSFEVQLVVYGADPLAGRRFRDELVDLLDLGPVLKKPVRTLSLGERMKCELVMALLYQPQVLFLDEPTIGVDVTMQARIRQFIADYNRRHGATVILTSHYMADVTALCKRVIVINHGHILFDGPLAQLAGRMAPFKTITLDFERDVAAYDFGPFGEVLQRDERRITLRVSRAAAAGCAARLLAELPVLDLTIHDPPIEDVISRVFLGGGAAAGEPGRAAGAAAAGRGSAAAGSSASAAAEGAA